MTVRLDGTDNLDSGQPFISDRYLSPAQTITPGGLITLTHGLTDRDGNAVKPFHISGYIKCLVAEFGYDVGDEVEVTLVNNSDLGANYYNAVWSDTGTINVRFSDGSRAFTTANKSTGATVALINANWELYIRAWV